MHLIFDLDGSLIDSKPGIVFSLQKAIRQVFPDSQPELLEFNIGAPVREMLQQTLLNTTVQELDNIEIAFRAIYDTEGWQLSRLYPEVEETLEKLVARRISLYIVTNKPDLPTNRILNHLNLRQYFLDVICPDSHQRIFDHKADIINYLIDKYCIQANEAVYVGDTLADQSAAEQCGLAFIGLEYGYGSFPGTERSYPVILTFPELLPCFTNNLYNPSNLTSRRKLMINRDIFEDLFVLELANNHGGDLNRGLQIIREFGTVVRYNDVRAAIKLQFRDVDTFIHKDFRAREDIRYIKKTIDTKLSRDDLATLVEGVRRANCLRMATPFDDKSVELCVELGIEIIKIASSDITDWPLLEKIAKTRLPVMVSTGGSSINNIDNMVTFFENRNLPLAINHCVSLYPSEDAELQLNQIDFLRNRYPGHVIGLSTHEYHDWSSSMLIAYAKGARTFERHVDIKTDDKNISVYCSTPEQIAVWFHAYKKAQEMCGAPGTEKHPSPQKEIDYLTSLVRGVYAKHDLPSGHVLTSSDYYLAIPLQKGQLSCRELLNDQVLAQDIKQDAPLMVESVDTLYNHDQNIKTQLYARGI